MGQITIRFCGAILLTSLGALKIAATEPTIKAVEESLTGKIAHISNLTINIECNPRQVIKDIKQDLFLLFCKIPEIPVRKYSGLLASSLYDLRYHMSGSALIGLYLYLFYQVLKANAYLASQDSWACWKQEISLQELLDMPQHNLSHELILEIQRRYTSADAPSDFVSSLVSFMKDIDQEIALIKYYTNLVGWLRTLRIAVIFPINSKRFASVQDHLSRLSYVRNVFLSWAAQYKMDQNRRCIT